MSAGGLGSGRTVVVKVGTSSITDSEGSVDDQAVGKLCDEVACLHRRGDRVVVVTSGAISAGLPRLGLHEPRPSNPAVLQAVSAVGQIGLIGQYSTQLARHGLVAGQVLLAPLDFMHRSQYLHARQTFEVLLQLGVVPVVNENDAIADDEIRFGDNDRLAALVAHLVRADVLVLLTDAPGLLTADPRTDDQASLIEEIVAVDSELEAVAGGVGGPRGSGGMASKLAAAKIAAWSGVRTVIAGAGRPEVVLDAVDGRSGVGTVVVPRPRRLAARKLWIAFALRSAGRIYVDAGAQRALTARGVSLLPAGVTGVEGDFAADEAVGICGPDGSVFAKGLARHPSVWIGRWLGHRTRELPANDAHEVVHRDDLVLLP